MQDNADLAQKIAIRQKALALLGCKPRLVIDAYSGEGVIAKMLWSVVADQLICIELDAKKAKLNPFDVLIGDNNNFVELFFDADVIDCDAYGLVMPLIEKIPSGKLVVFTDGTPEKARKVFSAYRDFRNNFNRLLHSGEFIQSEAGNVIYGYGIRT